MGREYDEDGLSYWLKFLKNGTETRDQVFEGFANSMEFSDICDDYGIESGEYVASDVIVKSDDELLRMEEALKKAELYLTYSPYSYSGLVEKLVKYDDFADNEAIYAADNCGADWKEQALARAKSYLKLSSFSYSELCKQLKYGGFSDEETLYGVDNCGADWN